MPYLRLAPRAFRPKHILDALGDRHEVVHALREVVALLSVGQTLPLIRPCMFTSYLYVSALLSSFVFWGGVSQNHVFCMFCFFATFQSVTTFQS